MPPPVLVLTKLNRPRLRSHTVRRERLIDELEAHPDARLLLVSAPAGFGKTTCLATWCDHLVERGTRVGWLSLDAGDNDPTRFGLYLRAAFAHALGEPFDPSLTGDLEAGIADMLNRLANTHAPCVLVVDDYHLIASLAIHNALTTLLEHLPENGRLVIGSRADPPLGLARLRARGHLVEMRAGDLRFTPDEVASYFCKAMNLSLSRQTALAVEQCAEGWAAGLQLLALSLDARRVSEAKLAELAARFSGSQRHIFDYLADEVFAQQPPEVQRFLLETSILDRLNGSLCGAVTGRCDAPLLLESLDHANLFISALDDERRWYRYHHLFADFLRERLARELPDAEAELHHRASRWFADQSVVVEAVDHALAAGDLDEAAELIERRGWEALTSRGEIATLRRWETRFSESSLTTHPRLCLYFSRLFYLVGQFERAEGYLRLGESLLNRQPAGEETNALWATLYTYRATVDGYRGKLRSARAHTVRAVALLPHEDIFGRTRLASTLGYLHYLTGEIDAGLDAYRQAAELSQRVGHHYLYLDAISFSAHVHLQAGHLRAAIALCRGTLADYERMGAALAPLSAVLVPLGDALRERNSLADAERVLTDAIEMADRSGLTDVLWMAQGTLARLLQARGDSDGADRLLHSAAHSARHFDSGHMMSQIAAVRARCCLMRGDVETAAAWALGYRTSSGHEFSTEFEDLTHARVLLAQGEPAAALELADALLNAARAAHRNGRALEALILRALALFQQHRTHDALAALADALALAEPEGCVRVFLDEGKPMTGLLRAAQAQGMATPYVNALLLASGLAAATAVVPALDALSERELEVLRLIAVGASNRDIADALVIGLGTVKSHINHIMSKLDARNRTEAVAKARAARLIHE